MGFSPFSTKDFDAYLQNKWESHVFNRERLEVREKLEALGKLLNPSLVGGDGAPLECEVSTEHPALWNQRKVQNQHLFFSRNKEARKEIEGIISKNRSMAALIEDPSPLRNHIFLAVMIDKDQVELSLKLHTDAAVDRDNLQRKCQEYFHREKLVNLIQDLPAGFRVGIYGQSDGVTAELDDEAFQKLIQDLPSCDSWLAVRRTLSREDPAVTEPDFVDLARECLTQLLPIHNFIAWSRENDFVSMRDTLKKKEAKTKSKGLSKNDRVRVVRGMFSGKTGVVQGTDAKGGLKVLLGSMMVKLTGEDVVKL
jgi:transcription antitermination factor NusG